MFIIEKSRLLTFLKLSLFQTVLFVSVYGFTNWVAFQHSYHYQLWHPVELSIPFIPWTILIYLSLQILLNVPAFILSVPELISLSKSMTWATLIAGAFFLIFPSPAGFIRGEVTGTFAPFFHHLYSLDKSANTFPSLHITFSYLFVRILNYSAKKWIPFFWGWLLLICLSVLLTHQHHLIDIAGGVLLAEFCFRKFYLQSLHEVSI
jgi:membrane-associated phospholipid phosphatase